MKTKRCSLCRIYKPVSEFHKNKAQPDGFANQCKNCFRETHKRYMATEKGKAQRKRSNASEASKKSKRKYWRSEQAKALQRQRTKQEKYKKYAVEKAKKFRAKYPERAKARDAVHAAIKYQGFPKASALRCSVCGKQAKEYHHHNGYDKEHWLDVIPVCKPCHINLG